jgi:hypothetical protein
MRPQRSHRMIYLVQVAKLSPLVLVTGYRFPHLGQAMVERQEVVVVPRMIILYKHGSIICDGYDNFPGWALHCTESTDI